DDVSDWGPGGEYRSRLSSLWRPPQRLWVRLPWLCWAALDVGVTPINGNSLLRRLLGSLSGLLQTLLDPRVPARRKAATAFRPPGKRAYRRPWSAGQVGRAHPE